MARTHTDTPRYIPVEKGTIIRCIKEHPDGHFTVGKKYKINAYRVTAHYAGVRVRDDKRERKDFNFIPASKNYFWDYFRVVE